MYLWPFTRRDSIHKSIIAYFAEETYPPYLRLEMPPLLDSPISPPTFPQSINEVNMHDIDLEKNDPSDHEVFAEENQYIPITSNDTQSCGTQTQYQYTSSTEEYTRRLAHPRVSGLRIQEIILYILVLVGGLFCLFDHCDRIATKLQSELEMLNEKIHDMSNENFALLRYIGDIDNVVKSGGKEEEVVESAADRIILAGEGVLNEEIVVDVTF